MPGCTNSCSWPRVCARRDEIRARLQECGIGSEIYYPVPVHRQRCFAHLASTTVSLPETDRAAAEVLSLPIFPELTRTEIESVVDNLAELVRTGNELRHVA